MKSKAEIKEWLLENAVNKYGTVDLSDIDFGDLIVDFSGVRAKNIYNYSQEANYIYNNYQKAKNDIYNYSQEANYIYNKYQKAKNYIDNSSQKTEHFYATHDALS